MFQSRGRHRFYRFDRFADRSPFGFRRTWYRSGLRGRRGNSAALTILLGGVAVFAFSKLLSAMNRPNRSAAEKIGLGALLAIIGAVLLTLRGRSARRYRW